jgi:hypothetical protein
MGNAGPQGRKRASREAIDGQNGVGTLAIQQSRPSSQCYFCHHQPLTPRLRSKALILCIPSPYGYK